MPPTIPPYRQERSAPIVTASSASSLPEDVVLHIFCELKQRVGFRKSRILSQSFPNDDIALNVGPSPSITGVNRKWRRIALSNPLLWSTFAIVLENKRSLAVANPGQLFHHLRYSDKDCIPLSIIIGTRDQLSGPGVVAENPSFLLNLDFLEELAPRVINLVVDIQFGSPIENGLFKPSLHFPTLESLTLKGISRSCASPVNEACFRRSPFLRRVKWDLYTTSRPTSQLPILPPSWTALVELLLGNSREMAISATIFRCFLSQATELERLQCRVCGEEDMAVNGSYDNILPRFHQLPFPPLSHSKLQVLSIGIQGIQQFREGTDSNAHATTVLQNFHLPNLQRMDYWANVSPTFDTASVIDWLWQESHSCLTHFECLVGAIDVERLLQGIKSMPFLEVLKWTGMGEDHQDLGSAPIMVQHSFDLYAEDHFLKSLANPAAFEAALLSMPLTDSIDHTDMPCPFLREVHIGHASFSNEVIEAFIGSRHLGSDSFCRTINSPHKPLVSIMCLNIGHLVRSTIEAIHRTRRLVKSLEQDYGAYLTVYQFVDYGGVTIGNNRWRPCDSDDDEGIWLALGLAE